MASNGRRQHTKNSGRATANSLPVKTPATNSDALNRPNLKGTPAKKHVAGPQCRQGRGGRLGAWRWVNSEQGGGGIRKSTYSQLCSNSTSESLKAVKTRTLTLPLCVWHRLWRQEQGRHVQHKTVSVTSGARIFCSSLPKREPTWLRPEVLRMEGKQQQQKYCLVSK